MGGDRGDVVSPRGQAGKWAGLGTPLGQAGVVVPVGLSRASSGRSI